MEQQADYIVSGRSPGSDEQKTERQPGYLVPSGVSLEFMEKVARIETDREALLALMNEIDAERRLIKSRMRMFSNSPREDGGWVGSSRYANLRKLKDKLSFLLEEREYVRGRLGRLKNDRKALNKALNSRKPEFCHAFVAAAERMLDQELFLEIEAWAAQICLQRETQNG